MKQDTAEVFKASCDNLKWLEKNYDNLKEDYDSKWIIVQNRKIVASDSSYEKIVSAMKKIDSKSALVEYVQSEQVAMFF